MTTSEKAVEVLKTNYGVDARIYEDNVFISHWNTELSDTIDIEISKDQIKDLAEEMKTEDILGDFDENGDAVDVKVNGYTNNETYRLCLVLDNTEYWKEDILQTFFRLVREDEFNANDINLINWNEVIERYSDDLIETHIHHHNE